MTDISHQKVDFSQTGVSVMLQVILSRCKKKKKRLKKKKVA